MKKLLCLMVMLLAALPVDAHFIWLVPHKDGQVWLVFSDNLDPDLDVPITKVAQTKVIAHSAGALVDPKKTEAKDHYLFTFTSKPPVEVVATCAYGVLAKKGDPFLLMYYAKTSIGPQTNALPKDWKAPPLDISAVKPGVYRVLWQGKPAPDAELTAFIQGVEELRMLKRDDDGLFRLGDVPAKAAGYIGLRAKFVDKKTGEHDGTKYQEIRHYSTWTFPLDAKR